MQAMLQSCQTRIVAEKRFDDAVISVVDHQWPQSFIFQDRNNSLHYRVMPMTLCLRGTLGGPAEHDLGNLMMVPAGSTLKVCNYGADHQARALQCLWGSRWIERLLGEPLDAVDLREEDYLGLENSSARVWLHRIALEMLEPGFASAALVESLLQSAVIELTRDARRRKTPLQGNGFDRSSAKLSRSQLNAVIMRIEESHGGAPGVTELAGELRLSVSHFRRLFRATTGQSVHEFISTSTIDQAKRLLANSHISMKEITYKLGFTSPSSFSVAFRRIVGCSPTEFRQKICN